MHAFLPDVVEQLKRYGHKDILVVGGVGKPALRRASAAVRVFEFERHGATRQSLTAQTATDRLTQQRDRRFDIPALGQILREGALIAHRFDLALLIQACDLGNLETQCALAHAIAVDAKNRGQRGLRCARKLAQRIDAHAAQTLLGRAPDTAHGRHRQRGQEALLGPGTHDSQAKWLIAFAGNFGHRLIAADANGAGHSQRRHAIADTPCNQQRVLGCKAARRDIDKGLVDGHALHARRLVGKNRHNPRAHLAVAIKVPVRPNGLRTQAPRLGRGHSGMHTKAARLIRTGGHDATRIGIAAHDERFAAPLGMVEHLHARKKRIEVHQAHRRTRPGRRRDARSILITVCMFASFHVTSIPRSSCGVRGCACKSRILV